MPSNKINGISYKEKYETDEYASVYGDLYLDKIGQLRDVLYDGRSDNNTFNVFGIEAGLGKSKAVVDLIDSNIMGWENNDNYLIVRKFKSDIINTVKSLKETNDFKINVLGITEDNWPEWRNKTYQLQDIRVLIISHKRYLELCLDNSLRDDFMQGRSVLIIDEKIQFPSYSFSKKYYDRLRSFLPISLQKKFDAVCNEFLNILLKEEVSGASNQFIVENIILDDEIIKEFTKLLENCMSELAENERYEFTEFIGLVKNIDKTQSIHNNGTISYINPDYKLWGLETNIILDASAEIDGIYKFGDFNVIGTERIVDHEDSTFTFFKSNTSKTSVRTNFEEISDAAIKEIKMNHSEDEKTLIISHKEFSNKLMKKLKDAQITSIGLGDDYRKEQIAINWFGNIIGNNLYSEFDNCWIIGTPNIPYNEYILMYMFYSAKNIDEIDMRINRGRFINEDLRSIQEGYIGSEIYQSIKRIQRNTKPKGKFYIINHDDRIIDIISSQIKGSKFTEIALDSSTKNKTKKSKDNTQKFIELVSTLPPGTYTKKDICETLDISSANFSRVLKNPRVDGLVHLGKIKIERTQIVITNSSSSSFI